MTDSIPNMVLSIRKFGDGEVKNMRKNKKRTLAVIICVILTLLIGFLIATYAMFREKLQAASSVQKIGTLRTEDQTEEAEHGIYEMEYQGDYGFGGFLAQGGAASSDEMAEYIISFLSSGFYKDDSEQRNGTETETKPFGCSTLSVRNGEGEQLYGRNYDWKPCDIMIVHTHPKTGYESYSTACLDFLGFGENWKPEGFANQYMALAAVYVPLDGMNEKGLCVADLMAGDDEETHQQTEKPDLTTTSAIRLLLDHAATVEEAVELLKQYDMNSDIGTAHHLSISDAKGNSVVVEYIDGQMQVTETPVVTNHYLTSGEHFGIGSEQSHIRYDTLVGNLALCQGIMNLDEVKENLSEVAQNNFTGTDEITVWSIVYDKANLTLEYYFGETYDTPYLYEIER